MDLKKYITASVSIRQQITRIDKKMEKMQKQYPTDYILLIVQDLWQTYYQILLIIMLQEFIRLNVNTDMKIKNVKLTELSTKIATAFLNGNLIEQNTIEVMK